MLKMAGRIGIAFLLAFGIAMLISWVTELDNRVLNTDGEPLTVFRSHQAMTLTTETIVDELASLKLNMAIERVSVGATTLEIDLLLPEKRITEEHVHGDLEELTMLAIARSDNIQRMFVRVLDTKGKERENSERVLMLALMGGKAQFSRQELERLRDGERPAVSWLEEKMQLTKTEHWRKYMQ